MKKLIFIVVIPLLFSCLQESKTKNLKIIDLAGNVGKTQLVNLSQIANDVEYIPLQTIDGSLLATPYKYLNLENEMLYISQFRSEIKIFNQNGEFIKTFNKQGRGPHEYEEISSFYIEPSTNNILIFTFGNLTEYNKEGDFIKRIFLDQDEEIKIFRPNKIFKIGNNLNLITFGDYKSKYSSCVTDSLFNVLCFLNYSVKAHTVSSRSTATTDVMLPYFYKFRDSVRIINGYDENILTVSDSRGPDTIFILNYGKYGYKNVDLTVKNHNELPFIRRFKDVYESSDYIFMQFIMGSLPHKPMKMLRRYKGVVKETLTLPVTGSIFNKRTGEFRYIDQPELDQFGFVDDFEGGPPFWPVYVSEDDYMVNIIDACKFIEYVQSHKVSEKLKKLAEGLKETDNPVLVLVKLKKE
jgi:hypothetical protein